MDGVFVSMLPTLSKIFAKRGGLWHKFQQLFVKDSKKLQTRAAPTAPTLSSEQLLAYRMQTTLRTEEIILLHNKFHVWTMDHCLYHSASTRNCSQHCHHSNVKEHNTILVNAFLSQIHSWWILCKYNALRWYYIWLALCISMSHFCLSLSFPNLILWWIWNKIMFGPKKIDHAIFTKSDSSGFHFM